MINLIINKINQTEIERKKMSEIHHENYNEIQKEIEHHRNKSKKNDVQKHVEKELSRHF